MTVTHVSEMDRLQRTGYKCSIIVVLSMAYVFIVADSGRGLVGFSLRCAGRVEYPNGTRVCNNGWTLEKADELCHELRCGKAVGAGRSSFGSSDRQKTDTCSQDAGVVCAGGFSKPVIAPSSSKIKWGDGLRIDCRVPNEIYQLTKGQVRITKTSVVEETKVNKGSVTLMKPNVTFEDEGQYECCYEPKEKKVKQVCSPFYVTVTVDLQAPNISVFTDEQPRPLIQTQVTRGYRFVIVCSTLASYPEGQFLLWFSGSNSSVSQPAVNHSASFNFSQSQYENQGEYYCVYLVTGAGHKYISPPSAVIQVTVKQPLLHVILPVVAIILVLLVLTGVYFCLRRRRVVTELAATAPSPMTTNRYESDNDDDDDDEDDNEEEADYVNVPPGGNNKEEDKQLDQSDEEPDYINIAVSQDELILDIYGGDENIYQNY